MQERKTTKWSKPLPLDNKEAPSLGLCSQMSGYSSTEGKAKVMLTDVSFPQIRQDWVLPGIIHGLLQDGLLLNVKQSDLLKGKLNNPVSVLSSLGYQNLLLPLQGQPEYTFSQSVITEVCKTLRENQEWGSGVGRPPPPVGKVEFLKRRHGTMSLWDF